MKIQSKAKYIKFPRASALKPKPVAKVYITSHFGDSNTVSYDLPLKEFPTPKLVKAEIKRRNKTVTKAFVLFPGDEFAESMTFSPSKSIRALRPVFDNRSPQLLAAYG